MAYLPIALGVAATSGGLTYGLACELAPHQVGGKMAAETSSSALNLTGLGGQHIAIGIFTLACLRSADYAPLAFPLNVGVEVCDLLSGVLEMRDQGPRDHIAVGAVAPPLLNLVALACGTSLV